MLETEDLNFDSQFVPVSDCHPIGHNLTGRSENVIWVNFERAHSVRGSMSASQTTAPILFKGGDTNLYGYVLNDPINAIDPSGLRDEVACAVADYYCKKAQDRRYNIDQLTGGLPGNQDMDEVRHINELLDQETRDLKKYEFEQREHNTQCQQGGGD